MIKKVFIYCCLLLPVNIIYAQVYPFTLFNTSNGLVNNRCGNISQDSAGYIWIGTDNGICNYDGRKFNFFPGVTSTYYFGQSQPNLYRGKCLLGTSGNGLAKCAGNTVEFIIPPSNRQSAVMSGLALNDSTYLLGRGNSNKLLLLKGRQEQEISMPEIIREKISSFSILLQDAEKNIWAGTNAGVILYPKGDLKHPFLPAAFLNCYCNYIKEDFEHNLYLSCNGNVYKIKAEQLKDPLQGVPRLFYHGTEQIPAMGFLKNGSVLLGQLQGGVKLYNKNLEWVKDISEINGLNNGIWDIFTDREGNTWFATENGIFRLRNTDFIYFPPNVNSSPNIKSGAFFNDRFLFSNGIDMYNIEKEKETTVPGYKNVPGYLSERFLVTTDNQLWINSYLLKKEPTGEYTTCQYLIENNRAIKKRNIQDVFQLPAPVNMQEAAAVSEKEMLFLTTDNCLYRYAEGSVTKITPDSTLFKSKFYILAKGFSAGEVWLVNATGMYRCRVVNLLNCVSLQLLQNIGFAANHQPGCIKILCGKNRHLWLATSNEGILEYQPGNNGYVLKNQITAPVISSELVTDLAEDSSGNLWVGSNNGIDKISFDSSGSYSVVKHVFDNLLTGRMIYFLKEKNNRLYIGTTGSLAIASINTEQPTARPIVHISHLSINNKAADSLLVVTTPPFEPDENNIGFEFDATSFINEKQTAYQYKLDGADTAWSTLTVNYMVAYNQLKPGNYTFRVKARNAENLWSTEDAVFSFVIKKPFYKHWAFYFLCAGLLGGFLYWLYRVRIAGILAVEKTRQHISKDLHDDIGNTLSSITLMNAVLKNRIQHNPEEAIGMAEKIENSSRQMIQNMSDIVWSINPGNDTLDKLQHRLQQFCSDVFEETDIQHKLMADESLLKKTIPMQLRRDIYLICKEIISNAAKYSKARHFMLKLSLEHNNICIVAEDDGSGFEEKKLNTGNGLNNIRQRTLINKGNSVLESKNGTHWAIKIPVTN